MTAPPPLPDRDDSHSPHQLSFDLHPFLSSIDKIADQHGLHHDSGVAFSGTSGSSLINKPSSAAASAAHAISSPSSAESQPAARFLLAPSGSSGSLKRPSTSVPEGGDPRAKRMIESPGVTGEFDARADTWSDVARRIKPFGDTLRHERLRTTLGETALGKDCVGLLLYSNGVPRDNDAVYEAQIEVLRVLANLCIDHDDNRERLLKISAPQAIARVLQDILSAADLTSFGATILSLLRTAAGALLNMQLDHPSTREVLRDDPKTIEMLLKLATDSRIYQLGDWYRAPTDGSSALPSAETGKKHISTGASVATWAWRIIQDVTSGDDEEGEGEQANGDNKSSAANATSDDDDKPIESLMSVSRGAAVSYLIQPLERVLASSYNVDKTTKGSWSGDDVADLMESDMDIVQIASELIESCSLDSRLFRITALDDLPLQSLSRATATQNSRTILEFLVAFLDVAQPPAAWSSDRPETDDLPAKPSDIEAAQEMVSSFERAKAAVARAIVSIVGEDENMVKLFQGQGTGAGGWFTETMKEWMTRDPKVRDDLVSTAMLAVGNLARKDAHCVALVHEHNLVPTLTALLVPTADIKVTHGVVCLLKNLAIPTRNKHAIGASNELIARLSPFLSTSTDKVQPLQFAAVGLLKHLCAGSIDNARDLVNKDTLTVLLDLVRRTDDVPTRMEGTRVLVNAIKTLWSSSSSSSRGAAGSGSNIDDRQAARTRLTSQPVVLALSDMIKSSTKYPVLVNEGILALTLVASEQHGEDVDSSGAQLVAKALQTLTPLRKTSNANGDKEASPTSAAGDAAAPPPRLPPPRQTTLDALASTTTQALPVPRTGADMIATVLSRGDARMPPQFANNACALVQALVQGGKLVQTGGGAAKDGVDSAAFIRSVLQAWTPALQQLSEVGPQESLPVAQHALEEVRAFTATAAPAAA